MKKIIFCAVYGGVCGVVAKLFGAPTYFAVSFAILMADLECVYFKIIK